jgi:tetratricopeptide (TPR) repeat protein
VDLFPELTQQARELTSRARNGEHLTIVGSGDRWLARDIFASLGSRAVLVETSRHVDSHLYALLAIGEQCGHEVGAKVAQQLRHSDLDASLSTVHEALTGRALLLVEGGERVLQSDHELRDVYKPQTNAVNRFLRERANVQAWKKSVREHSLRPQPGTPRDDSRWDSPELWKRCGHDLDLYLLAVSASLLGYPLEDDVLQAGAEEVAFWMWELLAEPLRELLELLIVHGRPLSRALLGESGLVRSRVLERATSSYLVEVERQSLTLAPVWYRTIRIQSATRAHQKLAEAFSSRIATSPLSVLDACRHFAEVPDLARVREHAAFGAPFLLRLARRQSMEARDDASKFEVAAQTYDAVLELDQQLRDQAEPVGIGDRPRAYAVHYRAYNRYRSGRDSIEQTLSAYREALALWRENALFWSRTISGCFVMGDYRAGVRASQDAYLAVPEHPERDAFLLERTVEHLMKRQLLFAAVLAWGRREGNTARETFDELLELTAAGWQEQHVWSPAMGSLWFERPITARIEEEGQRFRATLDGVETVGDSVMEAVRVATESLHRKVLASLMTDLPGPDEELLDEELLDKLGAARFSSGDESERWIGYLAKLRRQALDTEITHAQRQAFLSLWKRASARISRLRRPAIGRGHDQSLGLSWSFADVPGKTFTVDILPDGRVEWFFRDLARGLAAGTEGDGETAVPDAALEHLSEFGAAKYSPAGG